MSAWSILLRLFLAVALVFNGATPVVASVHMDHVSSLAATSQPDPAPAKDPPCHQHDAGAVAATDQSPGASADEGHVPPSPDCCDSGGCVCACVHHVAAVILDFGIPAPIIERAVISRPMRSGHAAPALPHLIRPPIG